MNAREAKEAIAPSEFYTYELPTMRSTSRTGWVSGGLCQFHDDNSPGSFHVNLHTGAYRCFSCGARGGDILAFLMERDGLTFPEAINQLSEEWSL